MIHGGGELSRRRTRTRTRISRHNRKRFVFFKDPSPCLGFVFFDASLLLLLHRVFLLVCISPSSLLTPVVFCVFQGSFPYLGLCCLFVPFLRCFCIEESFFFFLDTCSLSHVGGPKGGRDFRSLFAKKLVKPVHYLLLLLLLLLILLGMMPGMRKCGFTWKLSFCTIWEEFDRTWWGWWWCLGQDPPSSSDHPGTTLQQSTRGTNFETLIHGKGLGFRV